VVLRARTPRELLLDNFLDPAMIALAAVHLIRWMVVL